MQSNEKKITVECNPTKKKKDNLLDAIQRKKKKTTVGCNQTKKERRTGSIGNHKRKLCFLGKAWADGRKAEGWRRSVRSLCCLSEASFAGDSSLHPGSPTSWALIFWLLLDQAKSNRTTVGCNPTKKKNSWMQPNEKKKNNLLDVINEKDNSWMWAQQRKKRQQ